ncbi:ABC transporter substrate-binding protein [Shewanella amazonensis]|nr:transporter substrate-binding domain-containing protein [Shewanella amazonensis]
MKQYLTFFSLLLLASSLSANGQPGQSVRVCSLNLAPQTMLNEQGQPDGYAVKILEAIAARLNWRLSIQYYPWVRVVHLAQQGDCDIVLTVLMREDYAQYMAFPAEPILMQRNVIAVRKGSHMQYDGNMANFVRKHSIAMYRDKAINDEFQQYRDAPWANIQLTKDAETNFKMLLLNRVEAVFENDLTAIMVLKKLNQLEQVTLLHPPLNETPAYITFPKAGKLAHSTALFDKAMADFKQTQTYQALQMEYLGTSEPDSSVKQP